MILTVDRVTKEYLEYQEPTPGSMLVAPVDLLGCRIGDAVPGIADVLEHAIWDAHRTKAPAIVEYVLRGRSRVARVIVRGDRAYLNINNVTEQAAKIG